MTRCSFTQRGLSLIELMVAMSLSLVIVGAAAYLYLATRGNQGKMAQAADASEVGNYALRLLGREVTKAGFYPSAYAESLLPNILNVYTNVTGLSAYNQGIFGCEGAALNLTTGLCETTDPSKPDTLVIAYFTSDVGSGQGGQRHDCEGKDVALSGVNAGRIGTEAAASANLTPSLPLFVANHYTLQSGAAKTSMTFDGRPVSTLSLLCKGLVSANTDTPISIIGGLADLQLLYGVTNDVQNVTFVTADKVEGEGSLDIDGATLTAWQRVVAVRICVVSKTYQTANAVSSRPQPWQDCDGNTQTATDGSLRKTYTQVFSVRNHLKASY